MAHSLSRPWHHGLLARRKEGDLHLLAGEKLLLLGGGGHDYGHPATLHGCGDSAQLCRHARAKRNRVCLLPSPRLPPAAAPEGYWRAETLSARSRPSGGL